MSYELFDFTENIPVILYRCFVSDGREVMYINNAIRQFINLDDKGLLEAEGLTSLTHKKDRQQVAQFIKKVPVGDSRHINYRMIDSHGESHWVKDEFKIIEVEGKVCMDGMISIVPDTDKVFAIVNENRQLYQSLFENEYIGVTVGPPGGKFTRVNKAFCELMGYSKDELYEMQMQDLSFEEDIASSHSMLSQLTDYKSTSFKMKKRYKTKEGRTIYAETSVLGIYDSGGKLTETVAVIHDVTNHLQIEEQLKNKNGLLENQKKVLEKSFTQLTKALNDLKDAQNRIVQAEKLASLGVLISGVAHEVNTPLAAISASSSNINNALDDILGPWMELVRSFDSDQIQTLIDLVNYAASQSRTLSSREIRLLKKQYQKTLIERNVDEPDAIAESLIYLKIYDGLDQWEGIFKEERANDIFKAAEQISSIIQNSRNINAAVQKVSRIISALKKFSFHHPDDKMVDVQIADTIETVLTIYDYQLKKIKLEKNIEDDFTIKGHPDELGQVWTNLIQNALQAIPPKDGEINITAKSLGNQYMVSIEDNGTGIPVKYQDKIFDAFYTTKAIGEGSGLGLSIAKEILERHNGEITFETQLNKGTRFDVTFNLQK
ncbi:MAG: ATP-binding protein [Bacteroidota bacterium]